jgi:valyl-tRNA synthetase
VGREFRLQQQLKNSEFIENLLMPMEIFGDNESIYSIIRRQLHCARIEFVSGALADDPDIRKIPFLSYQLGFISPQKVDESVRKEEMEKELLYYQGFLEVLNKKLSNEKFVSNAKPEVISLEKKKKSDTESKIAALRLTLNA